MSLTNIIAFTVFGIIIIILAVWNSYQASEIEVLEEKVKMLQRLRCKACRLYIKDE